MTGDTEDVDSENPRPAGHYRRFRGTPRYYLSDDLASTVMLGPAADAKPGDDWMLSLGRAANRGGPRAGVCSPHSPGETTHACGVRPAGPVARGGVGGRTTAFKRLRYSCGGMREATVRKLRFVALQAVGAVAVVHLVVGGSRLARTAGGGLLGRYLAGEWVHDPRALLFVVSGLAIAVGIVAVARGLVSLGLAYRLGLLVLAVYVLGWVGWHTVLDHGYALRGSTPTELEGHSHGGLLDTLYSHYVAPLVAAVTASTQGTPGTGRVLLGVVSVTLELVGMALLAVLLRVDPAVERSNPFDPLGEEDGETEAAEGSEAD